MFPYTESYACVLSITFLEGALVLTAVACDGPAGVVGASCRH